MTTEHAEDGKKDEISKTNKLVHPERRRPPLPSSTTAALVGPTCPCEVGPVVNEEGEEKNGHGALIVIRAD